MPSLMGLRTPPRDEKVPSFNICFPFRLISFFIRHALEIRTTEFVNATLPRRRSSSETILFTSDRGMLTVVVHT